MIFQNYPPSSLLASVGLSEETTGTLTLRRFTQALRTESAGEFIKRSVANTRGVSLQVFGADGPFAVRLVYS